MAAIPGSVRVGGFIAPTDSSDTYASQSELYHHGGYRTVATIAERNAIPAPRRKEGMLVKVLDAGGGIEKLYALTGGILDGNWGEAEFLATTPAYTVEVAKAGRPFTSIQAAIDSITVAPGERWVVLVHPGDYAENVVLKDGVDLVGRDPRTCRVTVTSGNAIQWGASANSDLLNMGVRTVYGANSSRLLLMDSGDHNIINCHFYAEGTSTNQLVRMVGAASAHIIRGCTFTTVKTGSGECTLISRSTSSHFLFADNTITMTQESDAGYGTTVLQNHGQSTPGSVAVIANNTIHALADGGDCELTIFDDHSVSNGIPSVYADNSVTVETRAAGTDGALHFFRVRPPNGDHRTLSRGNTLIVGQGDFGPLGNGEEEWFCRNDSSSGATFTSHMDVVKFSSRESIPDAMVGPGVSYSSMPNPGDLQLSGVVVPRVKSITSDYGATESWMIDSLHLVGVTDATVTFPSDLSGFKEGQRVTLHNLSDYRMIIDPNGHEIDDSLDGRQIAPFGYVTFVLVAGEVRTLGSRGYGTLVIPDDVANLELWIDPDDSTTVSTTGALVDSITSKDASGTRVGTALTTARPTLVTASQNHRDTLDYLGGQSLSFGDVSVHNNGVGRGLHVFVVAKPEASGDTYIGKGDTTGDQREWYVITSRARIYEAGTGTPNQNVTISPSYAGDWQITEMAWAPAGNLQAYINGNLLGTSGGTIADITAGTEALMIGDTEFTSRYLGEMAEILVYSRRLTEAERGNLINYLAVKWDIKDIPIAPDSTPWDRNGTTVTTTAPDDLVVAGAFGTHIETVTADTVLTDTDGISTVLIDAGTTDIEIELPAVLLSKYRLLRFLRTDSSSHIVRIKAAGVERISGVGTVDIRAQWESVNIQCDGLMWVKVSQDDGISRQRIDHDSFRLLKPGQNWTQASFPEKIQGAAGGATVQHHPDSYIDCMWDVIEIDDTTGATINEWKRLRFASVADIYSFVSDHCAPSGVGPLNVIRMRVYDEIDGGIQPISRVYGVNSFFSALTHKRYKNSSHKTLDTAVLEWSNVSAWFSDMRLQMGGDLGTGVNLAGEDRIVWFATNHRKMYSLPRQGFESELPFPGHRRMWGSSGIEALADDSVVTNTAASTGEHRIFCNLQMPGVNSWGWDTGVGASAAIANRDALEGVSSRIVLYHMQSGDRHAVMIKPVGIDRISVDYFDQTKYDLYALFSGEGRSSLIRKLSISQSHPRRGLVWIEMSSWAPPQYCYLGRRSARNIAETRFFLRDKVTGRVSPASRAVVRIKRSQRDAPYAPEVCYDA